MRRRPDHRYADPGLLRSVALITATRIPAYYAASPDHRSADPGLPRSVAPITAARIIPAYYAASHYHRCADPGLPRSVAPRLSTQRRTREAALPSRESAISTTSLARAARA